MKVITGDFETEEQMTNARDDLISTGIDAEKVTVDREHMQLKVVIPADIEREINEILQRHDPLKLH
ncbi:hypothetical protein [Arhodomonas sp. SL1]|uniref:hypothetical protein n=1 Tax=Arhodomonas sp. SL1 TaxID=3425691 RepID=UPI003F881B36